MVAQLKRSDCMERIGVTVTGAPLYVVVGGVVVQCTRPRPLLDALAATDPHHQTIIIRSVSRIYYMYSIAKALTRNLSHN